MSHYSYIKSNHLTHLLATCIPYVQDSAEYNFALYYALHYVLFCTVQYAIHFALLTELTNALSTVYGHFSFLDDLVIELMRR